LTSHNPSASVSSTAQDKCHIKIWSNQETNEDTHNLQSLVTPRSNEENVLSIPGSPGPMRILSTKNSDDKISLKNDVMFISED
jgi:hypothetical protein